MGRSKSTPPYKIEDFLPIKQEQTLDDMRQNLLSAFKEVKHAT